MFSKAGTSRRRRISGLVMIGATVFSGMTIFAGPAQGTVHSATTVPTCATLDQQIAEVLADLQWATGWERIYDMRALNNYRNEKAQLGCP